MILPSYFLQQIGILAGTFLLIGPSRVSAFFLKKSRLQATIITSIGIVTVDAAFCHIQRTFDFR